MEGSSNNFDTLRIKLEPADDFENNDASFGEFDEDAENIMESLIQRIKAEHAEIEETDAESAGLGNIVAEIEGVNAQNAVGNIVNEAEFGGMEVLELKVEVADEDIGVGKEDRNSMVDENENGIEDENGMVEGYDESEEVDVESVEKEADQSKEDEAKDDEYEEDGTYTCVLCKNTLSGGTVAKKHLREHISIRSYECLECDLVYTSDCFKDKHTLIQFEIIGESLQGRLYRYFSASQLLQKKDSDKNDDGFHVGNRVETEQLKTDGQSELKRRLTETAENLTKLNERLFPSVYQPATNVPETAPVTFEPASLEVRTNIPYVSKHPFICLECQKGFVNGEDLKAHNVLIHKNDHLHLCPHCNMGFPKERALKAHLKINEGKGCQVHICTFCNKSFRKREPMRTHMFTHTGKGLFECQHCKKTWKNRSVLKRHLESHRTEKAYMCSVCDKYFSTANSLKIHMNIHTGERSFPCEICNKVYSEKRFLRVHMCTHTGEGNYGCKICSKSFYSSSQLKLHMCKHTGERPHVCKICNEAFLVRNSLLRHMYRHNGEKPYSCITCGKKFVLKQDLNEHTKTHALRTHICKLCHRGFTTGAYLNRHMKQHGKKNGRHECEECGLYFMQQHSLRRHKAVHRDNEMDDEVNDNETDGAVQDDNEMDDAVNHENETGDAVNHKEMDNAINHDNEMDDAVNHDNETDDAVNHEEMDDAVNRDNDVDEEVCDLVNVIIKQETEIPNVFV